MAAPERKEYFLIQSMWNNVHPRDNVLLWGGVVVEKAPSLPLGSPSLSMFQLTVGTWFKLYSLALSRRLAMLLAMFIPWDVLVLEQVGG